MRNDPIVIVAATRTPMGNYGGYFKNIPAPQLGAAAIKAAIERAQLAPENIEEVLIGCVLSAGQGQAPARQAAIAAGVPVSANCTTVNKMCGSGMKAIMIGCDEITAHSYDVVVAGGMENMSQAPYLTPKARFGHRIGHGKILDHMMHDGLEDAYDQGRPMGYFAEQCVNRYKITRKAMDEFAIASLKRAKKANEDGSFDEEVVPITVSDHKENVTVSRDENALKAKPEKIPQLKPVFAQDGTITAANASSISDGAAAVILMRKSKAIALNITPLATVVGHYSHAQEPAWFTTAPIKAIQGLLNKIHWQKSDVDLFEINEAFAVVAMATMRDLSLSHAQVNIRGGACALGHPIGASGTRILVTLLHALRQQKLKRGVAALCIGGGEATAIAIEIE